MEDEEYGGDADINKKLNLAYDYRHDTDATIELDYRPSFIIGNQSYLRGGLNFCEPKWESTICGTKSGAIIDGMSNTKFTLMIIKPGDKSPTIVSEKTFTSDPTSTRYRGFYFPITLNETGQQNLILKVEVKIAEPLDNKMSSEIYYLCYGTFATN